MREAFEQLVRSGRFVLGQTVSQFEAALASACGAEHAVGMSSGTDALIASLMALGVGPGDEVIVPTFTFFATAGSVARVGATPVFVDIDEASFNLDAESLEQAMTSRTRAVIPVHLYGQPADMDAIVAVAGKHGVKVIEDAAQAIGAKIGDRFVGSIGDVGCLSFYPTKNLSALGDAGACLTNDAELADQLRCMRLHGETSRYHHAVVGGNFRIDALQAAMLQIKLAYLEQWNDQRRAAAARYDAMFSSLPVVTPAQLPGRRHVYHQYTIRVEDGRRDGLREHLAETGIGHGVFYPVPLHLQACFAELGGGTEQHSVAERIAAEVISLPIFPGITEAQQGEVVRAIQDFLA